MNLVSQYPRVNFGLGQSGQQIMSSTGQTLMAAGAVIPVAGPFVALAGAVTELLASVGIGKGCGQTCITASNFANQAEALLKQNLAAYMGLSTPRAQSAQQAALSNFQQIWNGLVVSCAGVPGTAGQNCVKDRQQGACKWRDSGGQCWNWWIGYHDPIANDPNVVADSVLSTAGAAGTVASAAGGLFSNPILLLAGAALIGMMILSQS